MNEAAEIRRLRRQVRSYRGRSRSYKIRLARVLVIIVAFLVVLDKVHPYDIPHVPFISCSNGVPTAPQQPVGGVTGVAYRTGQTLRTLNSTPPTAQQVTSELNTQAAKVGTWLGQAKAAFDGQSEPTKPVEVSTPATAAQPVSDCSPCATASPVSQETGGTPAEVAARAILAAGKDWDPIQMLSIVGAESTYRPTVRNSIGASGLFQMRLPMHKALFDGDWRDPYANARAAHRLWKRDGLSPWVSSRPHWGDHTAEARSALAAVQNKAPSTTGAVTVDGQKVSAITARQILLAEKIGHVNLTVVQGGYGGRHVAASGTSHNYPGVVDIIPGTIQTETLMRRVGFAAWARNVAGRSSVGSGAHVHAVSLLEPGDKSSPQVYGSWAHHGNGLSGTNNDPAPHISTVAGLAAQVGTATAVSTCAPQGGVLTASVSNQTSGRTFALATFNVLGANHNRQGPPLARMRLTVQKLAEHGVDLVGLQEFQSVQAKDFASLAGATYGLCHDPHNTENAIAYRRSVWELQKCKTAMISYFHGVRKPMAYAQLKYRPTGASIWLLNVHNPGNVAWAHHQRKWRDKATRQEVALLTRLRAGGDAVYITGDVNDVHDGTAWTGPMQAAGMHGVEAPGRQAGGIDKVYGSPGTVVRSFVSDRDSVIMRASDHPMVVARQAAPEPRPAAVTTVTPAISFRPLVKAAPVVIKPAPKPTPPPADVDSLLALLKLG